MQTHMIFVVALTASLMSGCKLWQKGSKGKEQVPGTYTDTASLGQAYDSTRKKILNVSCIEGQELAGVGNSTSELTLTSDMDFKSLVDKLNGDLGASVTFPSVTAGASAKLALESQNDERSETHNLVWIGVNRKRIFKQGTLKLSAIGDKYTNGFKAVLQDKCGDEYVSEIQYGASLLATLKVSYMNSSDKFEIGGSLSLQAFQGVLKAEGNLNKLNLNLKKRTRVSVIAKQFGGNPAGLLTVIPKGIVSCTLDNLQPCLEAFNNIVDYATNRLSVELTGKPVPPPEPGSITSSVSSTGPGYSSSSLGGAGSYSTDSSSTTGSSSSTSTSYSSSDNGTDPTTQGTGDGGSSSLGLDEPVSTTSQSNWNVLKYTTARYDESGFEILTPLNGWIKIDPITAQKRELLQDLYVSENAAYNRATFLINNAGGFVSPLQMEDLKLIERSTKGNIAVLVEGQLQCLNDVQSCSGIADKTMAALVKYDKSKLDIEVGQKRTIGNYNYYNIIGGFESGGKYDDTSVGGNDAFVTGLEFATEVQHTVGDKGSESRLVGVRVTYKNGKSATHGKMQSGQVQSLDLQNDPLTSIKIFFTSSSNGTTPRVVGISLVTKSEVTLAVGQIGDTYASFIVPKTEVLVGFAGSSGDVVDSLGMITRNM